MKNKDLLKIITVIIVGCTGLYFGVSAYVEKCRQANKANVTEDSIINNLNSGDISDLVGDQSIEDEEKDSELEINNEIAPIEQLKAETENQTTKSESKTDAEKSETNNDIKEKTKEIE